MDGAFASLAESFLASLHFALKWFLARVSEVVFYQVLLEGELFTALLANPLFVYLVDLHVPLQAVLRFENFAATKDVAPEFFLTLLICLRHLFK